MPFPDSFVSPSSPSTYPGLFPSAADFAREDRTAEIADETVEILKTARAAIETAQQTIKAAIEEAQKKLKALDTPVYLDLCMNWSDIPDALEDLKPALDWAEIEAAAVQKANEE